MRKIILLYSLLCISADSFSAEKENFERTFTYDAFLSTSAFANVYWKEQKNNCISLYASSSLRFMKKESAFKRIHELKAEIGYAKYIDSTWIKQSDYLYLNSIWIYTSSTIQNSFTINLKTQIADTWIYQGYKDPVRTWTSGPLLPASLVAGYGMNIQFQNKSYINIAFASLKLNSKPRFEFSIYDSKNVIVAEKVIYNTSYGLQLQCMLTSKLLKSIDWEYRAQFFATGIDKKQITFDAQNSFSFRPVSFIKLRLEQKIAYDFYSSEHLQFRVEMMMGFVLEK